MLCYIKMTDFEKYKLLISNNEFEKYEDKISWRMNSLCGCDELKNNVCSEKFYNYMTIYDDHFSAFISIDHRINIHNPDGAAYINSIGEFQWAWHGQLITECFITDLKQQTLLPDAEQIIFDCNKKFKQMINLQMFW